MLQKVVKVRGDGTTEEMACGVVAEWSREKETFRMEFVDMDIRELAMMCGALEQIIGYSAYRDGRTLDHVKDMMLDIHLAAMDGLTEQVIREGGKTDGG